MHMWYLHVEARGQPQVSFPQELSTYFEASSLTGTGANWSAMSAGQQFSSVPTSLVLWSQAHDPSVDVNVGAGDWALVPRLCRKQSPPEQLLEWTQAPGPPQAIVTIWHMSVHFPSPSSPTVLPFGSHFSANSDSICFHGTPTSPQPRSSLSWISVLTST